MILAYLATFRSAVSGAISRHGRACQAGFAVRVSFILEASGFALTEACLLCLLLCSFECRGRFQLFLGAFQGGLLSSTVLGSSFIVRKNKGATWLYLFYISLQGDLALFSICLVFMLGQ